jgi:hypothetical protein
MSTVLSGDHTVTEHGVSSRPPIRADLSLDGQDAWVQLTLTDDNLREVLRELLRAFNHVGHDRIKAQHGGPDVSGPALERLVGHYAIRQALTFRISQADADDLSDELDHLSGALDRCDHPAGCSNVCAPGSLRCPVHGGTNAGAA